MFNPSWIILAIVLAFSAGLGLGEWSGATHADTAWTAKIEKQTAAAERSARAQEIMWQGVINGTVENYEKRLKTERADVGRELERVRRRPARAAGVSDAPRPDCTGGTGAELSGADAEFLIREAARADELRAGIDACYAVIDGTRQGRPGK